MRLTARWLTVVCLLSAAVPASAQHLLSGRCCKPAPDCCPCPTVVAPAPAGEQPKMDQQPMIEPTFAPEQAAAGSDSFAMNMIGDFIAVGQRFSLVTFPLASHSLKVAVNQNVRPQDRVYVNFNFYDNLLVPEFARGEFPGADAFTTVFGIEKTLLDGYVSIGARLPINSLESSEFGSGTAFGDAALIVKALLVETGSGAISAGIGISAPTGPDIFAGVLDSSEVIGADDFHTFTIQPFIAGLTVNGNFFAQAWTAVAIPFEDEVPSIWMTDFGAGYFLYRSCGNNGCCCRGLTALAGILELHINVPLDNDSSTDLPIGIPDWIVLVEGVTAQFGRSTLTLGLGQPLTGPKPYQMEGIIQFNLFF